MASHVDYGIRVYDPRIGRFLSLDPLQKKYPWYTPYQFSGNTPIQAVDLDGREELHYIRLHDDDGNSVLVQIGEKEIVDRVIVGYRSGNSFFNDAPLPVYETRINQRRKYIVHDTYTTLVDNNPTFGDKPIQEWKTYNLRWYYNSEEDARSGTNGTRDYGDWTSIALDRSQRALKEENAANGGYGMIANLSSYALSKFTNKAFSFLIKEEFQSLSTTGVIDPRKIRFSQNNIASNFKNGDDVQNLIDKLKSGQKIEIEPIRIVEKDGMIFTLDNRRLYAFQKAGMEIPYVKLDKIPKKENFKFSTTNNGVSIEVRPPKTSK